MARWWEHPKMWPGESEVGHRGVGFLDLFYDLIFVVAIAQVAHGLAKHPDPEGVATFVMLFLPIFWVWIGHTFYADRFENRDISHMFYTFAAMLPVVGMAVFAHDGTGDTARGFIFSYVAARLLLSLMWLRGAIHNKEGRRVWQGLGLGFGVGALAWLASAFVEGEARWALQIGGLVWDLLLPSLLAPSLAKMPPFSESRLRERYGLITIIVLGESIAGTVNGLADVHDLGWRHGLTGLLAMVFAFGVYFTYFEMVPRMRLKAGIRPGFTRTYLHFPLMAAIAATGAGVLATVGHESEVLGDGPRNLVALAIAVAYVTMVGLSRVHQYPESGAGRKGTEGALWLSAGIATAVAFGGAGWTSLQVLAALAASALLPPFTGMWHWRKATHHLPKQPKQPSSGAE